jgi:hypothetical protein
MAFYTFVLQQTIMNDQSKEQEVQDNDLCGVQNIYFNSFGIKGSLSDLVIDLALNGDTTYRVNVSYTVAKTLAVELNNAIESFEKKSGMKLLTVDELNDVMERQKNL